MKNLCLVRQELMTNQEILISALALVLWQQKMINGIKRILPPLTDFIIRKQQANELM